MSWPHSLRGATAPSFASGLAWLPARPRLNDNHRPTSSADSSSFLGGRN